MLVFFAFVNAYFERFVNKAAQNSMHFANRKTRRKRL